jgi:hypothetical protein
LGSIWVGQLHGRSDSSCGSMCRAARSHADLNIPHQRKAADPPGSRTAEAFKISRSEQDGAGQPEKRRVSIDFPDLIFYSQPVTALSFSGGRPLTFGSKNEVSSTGVDLDFCCRGLLGCSLVFASFFGITFFDDGCVDNFASPSSHSGDLLDCCSWSVCVHQEEA